MEFLIIIVEKQVGLKGAVPRRQRRRGRATDTYLLPSSQAAALIQDSPALSSLASVTALQPFFYVVQQTIHWLFMGYSMTAFCLFTWDKWLKVRQGCHRTWGVQEAGTHHAPDLAHWLLPLQVYKSVYFIGHVFFLSLLFTLPYIHKAMVPRKEKLKKKE